MMFTNDKGCVAEVASRQLDIALHLVIYQKHHRMMRRYLQIYTLLDLSPCIS